MKHILFILTILSSSLFANMGAILIIPRDADLVIGIYSGSANVSTDIKIDSTDNDLDGRSCDLGGTEPFVGGYLGFQNSFYRFSFSCDVNNH